MNAFDVISTIPAKSVDWAGLRQAIRSLYVAAYGDKDPTRTLARYDAAQGLREVRFEIGAMANCIIDRRCEAVVNHMIPASPDTLSWGGFLGGTHIVYAKRDDAKEVEAVEEIATLVTNFRKGRNS